MRDAVDAEFTVEQGTLWFLSASPAKRSARAALHIVTDFVRSGVMTEQDAVLRIDPLSLDQLLHSTIDAETPSECDWHRACQLRRVPFPALSFLMRRRHGGWRLMATALFWCGPKPCRKTFAAFMRQKAF